MRARQWRGRIWAARLGLLALALNALVPVHLAFDLAEAFEPAQHCVAHPEVAHLEVGGVEHRLLALLSGHPETDDTSDDHGKHHACPVCSALGALAAFAPPTPTALPAPFPAERPAAHFVSQAKPVGAATAYRSRAPPLA